MTTDASENKKLSNKIVISAFVIIGIIFLSFFVPIIYNLIFSDKIYSGVVVSDIKAGGLTKKELLSTLNNKYNESPNDKLITIKAKGQSESFTYKQAKVNFEITKACDEAYNFGRTGTFFEKFFILTLSRTSDFEIPVTFSYDKAYISHIIDSLEKKVNVPVKDPAIEFVHPTKVTLVSGHNGETLKKDSVLQKIENYFQTYNSGNIKMAMIQAPKKQIILDEIYKKVNSEPQNAYVTVTGNKYKIIPQVLGRKIDKNELSSILKSIGDKDDIEEQLPVTFQEAQIKTGDVEAKLFTNTLSSFSTQFYTGDKNNDNRKVNISIVSSILNGKLIASNETFSFNKIVGPRTPENGYKDAHAYIGGKIVDSTGGGICQVSTTLYNAVLLADLNVVERHNHMFTVGYVPKGQDAAVAYNSSDFQFKNSTNWPIKISCYVSSDNRINFSLIGTKESSGKTIEIRNVLKREIEPQTESIDDPTMPEGTTQVINGAMMGYVIDTFKITKQNGSFVKEDYMHTSKYSPLAKQVKAGTKKVATQAQVQSQTPTPKLVTPVPTRTRGVDDAYNPPAQ